MTQYQLKRAYEPASPEDGFRVYIADFGREVSRTRLSIMICGIRISRRPQNSANGFMRIPITDGLNLRLDIPKNWRPALRLGHCDIFLHRNL